MLSVSQRKSLEKAASRYEGHLDEAMPYLAARGITEQTARTYRLGYVREPVRGDDEMVGRLSIPYLTTSGVVDIRYRTITGQTPKYMSRTGSAVRMYGVQALLVPSRSIVVCEGEIDCITFNQAGIPAVGIPGANAWKDHWRLLFSDYDDVIVVCDGDQPGRDFGKKIAEKLDGVSVVHLPDGEDANSIYAAQGEGALRERIAA